MLNEKVLSIESLILCLSGFEPIDETLSPPILEKSDYNLIHSLSRQLIRNIGFTDRQYELAKKKVDDYSDYFSFLNDIESIKETHTLPLRQIDRSRWIKIIENEKNDFQIAVRFTFQKKLISAIESLRSKASEYDKQNKIHYFPYNEKTLYDIIEMFQDKNFEIDNTALDIYQKIKSFKKEDCLPGIYNQKLKNLNSSAKEMIENEIGEFSEDTALLYKDRCLKYAINVFNYDLDKNKYNTLTYNIANRSTPHILISDSKYNLDDIIVSLDELKRLPMLCIVPQDTAFDSIVQFHQYARNLIASQHTSVSFRMDNQGEGIEFNKFIRDNKLNNKVDSNTKLLYTTENKVPKPLVQAGWKPNSIFVMNEGRNTFRIKKVVECFPHTDLVMFYKDATSPHFGRHFIDKHMDYI